MWEVRENLQISFFPQIFFSKIQEARTLKKFLKIPLTPDIVLRWIWQNLKKKLFFKYNETTTCGLFLSTKKLHNHFYHKKRK